MLLLPVPVVDSGEDLETGLEEVEAEEEVTWEVFEEGDMDEGERKRKIRFPLPGLAPSQRT